MNAPQREPAVNHRQQTEREKKALFFQHLLCSLTCRQLARTLSVRLMLMFSHREAHDGSCNFLRMQRFTTHKSTSDTHTTGVHSNTRFGIFAKPFLACQSPVKIKADNCRVLSVRNTNIIINIHFFHRFIVLSQKWTK